MSSDQPAQDELRARAIKRLKKVRDFHAHLLVYVLVNSFLVVIWAASSPHSFFWPVFPLGGWGIGLAMNAWDVYLADEFGEDKVQREMQRLQRKG